MAESLFDQRLLMVLLCDLLTSLGLKYGLTVGLIM